MNRTARDALADARLAEAYAQVPAIACKGLCHTTCTVIEMSCRERQVLRERHGVDIPELPRGVRIGDVDPRPCPALTPLHRCGVYEDRPMLCRVWGVVQDLPCIYGCVPDGGYLSNVDGVALLAESFDAGGSPPSRPVRGGAADLRANVAARPQLAEVAVALLTRGAAGDRRAAGIVDAKPIQ